MSYNSDRLKRIDSCIVIGGGITGLITATILQRKGIEVTVLDKGRGIGGRLATKRIDRDEPTEAVFDYGTQYFSVEHPKLKPWIDDWLKQGIIKEWFGNDTDKIRYCGVNGTRGIAKYLAKDLNVHTSSKVIKVSYDEQWLVETEGDRFLNGALRQRPEGTLHPKGAVSLMGETPKTALNRFYKGDTLIMTPPVPQSLALLDASEIALPPDIKSSLERVRYYSCIAVLALLEKHSNIPAPGGIALEDESLIWLADTYQKGISNSYAVTLHATPKFSETHWDSDDAEIADKLFTAASEYLNSAVTKYQVHRWRYSLPKTFYNEPCLVLPELSLVMAGDAFVAPKIAGAMLSGIAASESIVAS